MSDTNNGRKPDILKSEYQPEQVKDIINNLRESSNLEEMINIQKRPFNPQQQSAIKQALFEKNDGNSEEFLGDKLKAIKNRLVTGNHDKVKESKAKDFERC